jgi:hypothetical protein
MAEIFDSWTLVIVMTGITTDLKLKVSDVYKVGQIWLTW